MDVNLDFAKLVEKYLNEEITFSELNGVFEEVIDKSIGIDSFVLGRLFDRDDEARNLILRKLNKVIEKLTYREGFFVNNNFFKDEKNIEKYAPIFLAAEVKAKKEDGTQVTVFYPTIYGQINKYLGALDAIQLIIENMKSIIKNCDSVVRIIKCLKFSLDYDSDLETEKGEIVDRIDISLADNIDEIISKHDCNYLSPEMLSTSFPKFRNAIKNKGKAAMYSISVGDDATIEECIELSQELFGEVSAETIAALKFGYSGEEKAKVIAIVIKELIEKSQKNVSIEDIKECGEGCFSSAYLVGDYVIKLGGTRHTQQITNHRRILQPIIRQKLYGKSGNSSVDEGLAYIEVQNAVDVEWFKEMKISEVEEILYKIYVDFRKQGLMWTDIKASNVGRLIRPNRINYSYIDTDRTEKELRPTEEATGIKGELEEQDILPKGAYVVIDTDYIFSEGENILGKLTTDYTSEEENESVTNYTSQEGENKSVTDYIFNATKFEERYIKEINSKQEYNER